MSNVTRQVEPQEYFFQDMKSKLLSMRPGEKVKETDDGSRSTVYSIRIANLQASVAEQSAAQMEEIVNSLNEKEEEEEKDDLSLREAKAVEDILRDLRREQHLLKKQQQLDSMIHKDVNEELHMRGSKRQANNTSVSSKHPSDLSLLLLSDRALVLAPTLLAICGGWMMSSLRIMLASTLFFLLAAALIPEDSNLLSNLQNKPTFQLNNKGLGKALTSPSSPPNDNRSAR